MEGPDHDQLIRIEGKIELIQATLQETKNTASSAAHAAQKAALMASETASLISAEINKRLDAQAARISVLENWRNYLLGGWAAFMASFTGYCYWKGRK